MQQILFFKEFDIPLKEIKEIMLSPYFDKMEALKNQRKLLSLIGLINTTLEGEGTMNLKKMNLLNYINLFIES